MELKVGSVIYLMSKDLPVCKVRIACVLKSGYKTYDGTKIKIASSDMFIDERGLIYKYIEDGVSDSEIEANNIKAFKCTSHGHSDKQWKFCPDCGKEIHRTEYCSCDEFEKLGFLSTVTLEGTLFDGSQQDSIETVPISFCSFCGKHVKKTSNGFVKRWLE